MSVESIIGCILSVIAIVISIYSIRLTIKLQRKQFDIDLFEKRFNLLNYYSNFSSHCLKVLNNNGSLEAHIKIIPDLVDTLLANKYLARCLFPELIASKIMIMTANSGSADVPSLRFKVLTPMKK